MKSQLLDVEEQFTTVLCAFCFARQARKVFAIAAIVALDFNILVLKVGKWVRARRGQ